MSPKVEKGLEEVLCCEVSDRHGKRAWYNVLGGSDCFNFSTFSESFKTRV
jgi:hypothetical protein